MGALAFLGWLSAFLDTLHAFAWDMSTRASLLDVGFSAMATVCWWTGMNRFFMQRGLARGQAQTRDEVQELMDHISTLTMTVRELDQQVKDLKSDRMDYFGGFADGFRLQATFYSAGGNVVAIPRRPINGYAHTD